MRVIDPSQTATSELYQILVGVVNPRPIAFASTLDPQGSPNLAPYSFFNCFSAKPPILVFSATRRATADGRKDTLRNIAESGEVVINVVPHRIAGQMALTSVQFPPGANEFEQSGLTPIPSELVGPFRVKESPVQMECRLRQIVPLGEDPGAGSLIICEILRIHLSEEIFDEQGRIDPQRLDLMGRLGRAFYVRAHGDAVHRIYQERDPPVIGFPGLPESLRTSSVLTGNELARLAGLPQAPPAEEVAAMREDPEIAELLASGHAAIKLHRKVRDALEKNDIELASRLAWLSQML